MKNKKTNSIVEFDEHVGIAEIYFPQLLRDLERSNLKNNKAVKNSFNLIEDIANKYFDYNQPIQLLIKKIKSNKSKLVNMELIEELFYLFKDNCETHSPTALSCYEENKELFLIKDSSII